MPIKKKIIIFLLSFLVIFVLESFTSFALAYSIDSDITEFKSFEDYIKYIEGEYINTIDQKVVSAGYYTKAGWADAKEEFCKKYLNTLTNDSSDADKNAYINELDNGIKEQKSLLKEYYNSKIGRGYVEEYYYKYLTNLKNNTEKAIEENKKDNDKSVDERIDKFTKEVEELSKEMQDLDTSTMTTEELSSKKDEYSKKMNDLKIELDSIKSMDGITEKQKEMIDDKYKDLDTIYKEIDKAYKASADGNMQKYKSPKNSGDKTVSATIDDVMDDAESILNHDSKIDVTDISNFSNSIFNIFLTIGIVVATIVGAILGVKFITSSVEGKADVKKMLIVYVAGCISVFGAFTIWKIVVTILQSI